MQASASYQLGLMINTMSLESEWSVYRAQARKVCDYFLTLGAASLLADMKVSHFFHNICRSADNWHRYLVSSRVAFNKQITLTYNAPLLAAIVANDPRLIERIARDIPNEWKEGEEYEDKFILSRLLIKISANKGQFDNEMEMQLSHFNEVAGGSPEVELLYALLALDNKNECDFWASFMDASHQHEQWIIEQCGSVTTNIEKFIAHRYIWFEGLAWLRLAMTKGYTLPSDGILYCPDEALESIELPFQDDWPLVPLAE